MDSRLSDPVDVLAGIEADVGEHGGEEHVLTRSRSQVGNRHRLAAQVLHRSHPVGAEQLEAADVNASQHRDRIAGVDPRDQRPGKMQDDVDLAGGELI